MHQVSAGDVVFLRTERTAGGRDDPRLATAFATAIGFALTLIAASVFTQLRPHLSPSGALAAIAGVVLVFGWWSAPTGVFITAGCGWLTLNGFVADRYGVLRWHGSSDLQRLGVLYGCAILVTAVRALQLSRRRIRATQLGSVGDPRSFVDRPATIGSRGEHDA